MKVADSVTPVRYDEGTQQSAPRDAPTSGGLIEGKVIPPMSTDDTSPVNPWLSAP